MPAATGTSRPAVPASFLYAPQPVRPGYSLIVLGRDPQNYDRASIEAHDRAGGITGVYLNHTLFNALGKYHGPLHAGSVNAPGGRSNGYGFPAVVDTALRARLETAMRRVAADFSYLSPGQRMFFLDDFGADNYGLHRSMTTAQSDQMYRDQVEAAKVVRRVCDELGWLAYGNAEWDRRKGHGYPNPAQYGCGLLDGQTCEHHASVTNPSDYWHQYMRDGQSNLKDAQGNNMGIVIASSVGEAQAAAQLPFVAFVTPQANGSQYLNHGAIVGTPRDLGMPGDPITPPPPPDLPSEVDALKAEIARLNAEATSLRLQVAQANSDLNGAREARDQAIDSAQTAIRERDEARAIALELKARIDAAKVALG